MRASTRRSLWLLPLLSASALAAPALLPRPVPELERVLNREKPATLDGRLGIAYRLARLPSAGEHHALLGESATPAWIRVSVRLNRTLDARAVDTLESLGCAVSRLPNGQVANVGPVVEANCAWSSLEALSKLPEMIRVEPTLGLPVLPPAAPNNTTVKQVEADAIRRAAFPKGRGAGITIADMDSGLDPFHPFLFRADGPSVRWIDVNNDGLFQPGIDAVDANGDGNVNDGERLGMIKANIFWIGETAMNFPTGAAFVPGVDWLYQDENNDGQRNRGAAPPFGDGKPTYGEQLYVVDDVDGDGVVDLGERLVMLKTPKVKAVKHKANEVFSRGVNLARATPPTAGDDMHGTMVLGTLGGGDPRYTKYAGLAPDADLLLASTRGDELVSQLSWALSQGANVVLWEMSSWSGQPMDGSTNLEVACDAASGQGVTQIGAAGNLGGSRKHRVKVHPAGTETLPMTIPNNFAGYAYGQLLWRGATAQVTVSVAVNGTTIPLTQPGNGANAGDVQVQWQWDTTPRGTTALVFFMQRAGGAPLPGGTATFTITHAGQPLTIHGYTSDDRSGWSLGVAWPQTAGATDDGTYGVPGTSDKTLSVATYSEDFVSPGETKGALLTYSGRGPRIDGQDSVDFAAPEDHITSLAMTSQGYPWGAMFVGGGTSNASPVAVGVAALLLEARPSTTPAQLATLLRTNTEKEAQMGTLPNDRWGTGKVRGYRALNMGALPMAVVPPVARGTALRTKDGALKLDGSASTAAPGQTLQYLWDVDYDGTYDLGPAPGASTQVPLSSTQPAWLKLQVVDGLGASAQALVKVEDEKVEPPDAGPPDAGAEGGGSAAGGGAGAGGGAAAGGGTSEGGGSASGGGAMIPDPGNPMQQGPSGCGCGATDGLLALVGAAWLARRRRR